jgi:aminopeptidase
MSKNNYHPPQKILERYADVLVNFALDSGKGIKKGDVVYVQANEYTKRLYAEILRAIWKAGGHAITKYTPDNEPWMNFDSEFFLHAEPHQIKHFADKFYRGLLDQIDHSIYIIGDTDLTSMKKVDPKKIMERSKVHKPWMEWRNEKENKGKFTWTLALYGTPAMAKEAKLSEKEYWNQIINACFLDKQNPIAEWKKVYKNLEHYRQKLNNMSIEWVHVKGKDVDLKLKIGEKRAWMGGSGRNIPSFELFTSPDWRGTEGWIKFNQPLYRYGNLIEGIQLWFKDGKVIKSKATKNEKMLQTMIATKDADKVGEFSMTDKRFSRITKFMAETLFDENMGGPFGNTHIALGNAYHDCYKGNPAKNTKKDWERLGYNDSVVHTDIVTTTDRTVTATLKDGTKKLIYKNGQFVL